MTSPHRALFVVLLFIATFTSAQSASPSRDGFQISGIVVDALTMDPIPGASVLIAPTVSRSASRTVRSGPDGRFHFDGVARGKYSLAGSSRGYPTQGYEQHDAYATAVAVGPELDSTHIVFRLQPGAAIRGRIFDEENEPVSNATLYLFATRTTGGRLSTQVIRNANSNDLGAFSFAHLSPGTYYVAISGRPWYSAPGIGQTRRMMRLRHQQQAALQTQDPSSEAPSGSRAADVLDNDSTNDASDELDKVFPLTFYGGATTSAEATAIDLQPGQTITADINVRAVPTVHLRIPAPDTSSSAQISEPAQPDGVFVSGGRGIGRARSRGGEDNSVHVQVFQTVFGETLIPAGAFMSGGPDGAELSGFAPGHYLLQISSAKQGSTTGSYQEADLFGEMDLPTASTPAATVSGTVQIEGAPVPKSLDLVLVNHQIDRGSAARLKASGEFTIDEPLIPGRYEVSVGNAEGWYISSITAAGTKISGRTLILNPGDNARLTLKIEHGLAEVTGTAFRDGKPMSGAMIILVPRNPGNSVILFRRDQSDSDGTFTLRDVVPGPYTLIAIQGAWKLPWSDPALLKRYLAKGDSLQVAPSAKLTATVTVQER